MILRLRFVFVAALLVTASCQRPPAAAPPLSSPVSSETLLPPVCLSGKGTPPGSMNAPAVALANLINDFREPISGITALPPDPIRVGVAQFHASDMGASSHVGFVASDGEDVLQRLVCSGAVTSGSFPDLGMIAIGYSTDPQQVFRAIRDDYTASRILFGGYTVYTSISVGYSNGYWMVIISR